MKSNLRSISCLVAIVALSLAAGLAGAAPAAADPGTLVTAEWLEQHLDDPNLVVLDCTVNLVRGEKGMTAVSGREAYDQGHIPTAGFADLTAALRDTTSELNYALPSPEEFCAAMGALGVGDDSRVVLYDANMSVWAARVWWMLRWVGFDRAALLDGGLGAWKTQGRPVSTEPAAHSEKQLTPRLRPALIADRDEVFAAIDDDSVRLIDSMPAPHYQGVMALYSRPGHIPGAVNVPVTSLLAESGEYRTPQELEEMFGDDDVRRITYCGSGIAASSVAFVLDRLGHDDVAVYIGSLQEWTADEKNPMVSAVGGKE